MKNLFLTILLLFAIQITNAQSHIINANYGCRLKPASLNSEKDLCPACAAKEKTYDAAKVAEKQQRELVTAEKLKKEKAVKQKAFDEAQKKKQVISSQPKPGDVVINGSVKTSTPTKAKPITNKKIEVSSVANNSNTVLSGKYDKDGGYWMVVNEKGETVLNKSGEINFKEIKDWNNDDSYLYRRNTRAESSVAGRNECILNIKDGDLPKNAAIVALENWRYNIVDSKGKMLLENNDISMLYYCGNEFFIGFTCQNDCSFNHDYIGQRIIIYDNKLKKTYVLAPEAGLDQSVRINRDYFIKSLYSDPRVDQNYLLHFTHPVYRGKSDANWNYMEVEHHAFGADRKYVTFVQGEDKYYK